MPPRLGLSPTEGCLLGEQMGPFVSLVGRTNGTNALSIRTSAVLMLARRLGNPRIKGFPSAAEV